MEQNSIPIYRQLAEEIKINILAGKMKPGERLPSVRDFALIKKVNPNTLQRALGELEEEGLIYTERTNGKFVTTDEALIEEARHVYAREITAEYLHKMQEIGVKPIEGVRWEI